MINPNKVSGNEEAIEIDNDSNNPQNTEIETSELPSNSISENGSESSFFSTQSFDDSVQDDVHFSSNVSINSGDNNLNSTLSDDINLSFPSSLNLKNDSDNDINSSESENLDLEEKLAEEGKELNNIIDNEEDNIENESFHYENDKISNYQKFRYYINKNRFYFLLFFFLTTSFLFLFSKYFLRKRDKFLEDNEKE